MSSAYDESVFPTPLAEPTPQMSTSATSISPKSSESRRSTQPEKSHTPYLSESEYTWRYLEYKNPENTIQHSVKRCWWRNVDAMANFILHWQTRFHQHGDMFLSCLLYVETQHGSSIIDLSIEQLREAMRRLRYLHPSMALRLAKRSELDLEQLPISAFIAKHVDLQVALVYDIHSSDAEIDDWLNTTLVVHTEPRIVSEEQDTLEDVQQQEFQRHVAIATQEGVPGRDRLVVHFWPADVIQNMPGRIVIEQNHSVSDGIGSFTVLDELLRSIASALQSPTPWSIDWGSEVPRLEPALQDVIADPPATWSVSAQELKAVKQLNADRMNGKASAPNLVDKIGGKLIAAAIRGNEASRSFLRRKILNTPIVKVCRIFTEKGEMFPLGLLPQTGEPHKGDSGHTAMLVDHLTAQQTIQLLDVLKNKNQTLAPFLEACMHMATTWTRKHRGLSGQTSHSKKWDGYDDPNRILGSYSNPITKRGTLLPQHYRYMGLCLGGLSTKIAAGAARWSSASNASKTQNLGLSPDVMPTITRQDLETLTNISNNLGHQYRQGRDNPNWLRYDAALMFGTMETEYLFLRDEAHYPSMPWLSSVGRIEATASGQYPFTPSSSEQITAVLAARQFRIAGRVGIRQPLMHVYTYQMQTILQMSYASCYYDPPGSQGRQSYFKHNKAGSSSEADLDNIVKFWFRVFKAIVLAVIHDGE